jgi:uncharacterized delta-60 repeat protein
LVAQPNVKLLVTAAHKGEIAVARLRRYGKLDRRFGRRGFASTGIGSAAIATGMIVGPSGKIDVAGEFNGASHVSEFIVQLTKHGKLDHEFGVNGVAQPLAGRGVDKLGGLVVDADGRLLVGAAASTPACSGAPDPEPCEYSQLVARLSTDGQLDPSFAGDGVAEIPILSSWVDFAVAPDGRIVTGTLAVQGTTQADGRPYSYVSRLLPDGSPDPTLGAGSGSVELRTVVSDIALSETGHIYGAGAAEGMFEGTALHSDGTIDVSFATNGSITKRVGEVTGGSGSFVRKKNGDLIIGGPVASNCRPRDPALPNQSRCRLSAGLVSLDAAGNLEPSFGHGGVVKIAISRSRKIFDPGAGVQLADARDGLRLATPVFHARSENPDAPDRPSAVAIAAVRNNGRLDRRYGDEGLAVIPSNGG